MHNMTTFIKYLILNKEGKILPQRIRKSFLKKHNVLDFINSSFDDSYSLLEKIYCLTHDCIRKRCKTCNKEIKFKHGYTTFCSRSCANKDPGVLNKNKNRVSESLKMVYKERGNEINKKRNETLYNKYGQKVNSPFGVKEIRERIKETNISRFGVENVFSLSKNRNKSKKQQQTISVEKNKLKGFNVEYLTTNKILIKDLCNRHGDVEMDCINFYNRAYRNRNGIICPICNPLHSFSSLEIRFENILKELNITDYIKNSRKIINPLEIDFYFKNFDIAVELNGVYWHSEIHIDNNYHKNKSDLCKDKKIQLIHIWEDDLLYKSDIIKSMLNIKFNKCENKIYASICEIKDINSNVYRNFLCENHIQGSINSSIKYGLFYNNELISVMGFGKLRISLGQKDNKDEYELHRFCSKLNTNVIGGASKLLNHFEKNIKFSKIISRVKRDYSDENLYYSLGFKLDKICNPECYWIVECKRKHRFNFRKDKIFNEFNKHMSSIEIMHENGLFRCFDSGNLKFVKKISFY